MHDGQTVELADGDWIVPEPDGIHYYPIKDEVMKANWERIVDPEDLPYECDGINCPPRAHDHKPLI